MAKTLIGKVVSQAGTKTIIVEINRLTTHPIYKKKFKVTRKISVHDEAGLALVGDTVKIAETKPISKTKSWLLSDILAHEQILEDQQ